MSLKNNVRLAGEAFAACISRRVLEALMELNPNCPRHNGEYIMIPPVFYLPCYCEEQGFVPSVKGYIT